MSKAWGAEWRHESHRDILVQPMMLYLHFEMVGKHQKRRIILQHMKITTNINFSARKSNFVGIQTCVVNK